MRMVIPRRNMLFIVSRSILFQSFQYLIRKTGRGSVANSLMCCPEAIWGKSIMAATSINGRHFQHDMILQSVRWDLAYALNYRDIEELMQERGFSVDHSTIHRWVLHYAPLLEAAFRRKKSVLVIGGEWMKAKLKSNANRPIIIRQSISKGRSLISS